MSGIHPARVGHSQILFGLPRLLFCTHAGEEESEEGCESSLAVYGAIRSTSASPSRCSAIALRMSNSTNRWQGQSFSRL